MYMFTFLFDKIITVQNILLMIDNCISLFNLTLVKYIYIFNTNYIGVLYSGGVT